jgi:hypothetical protein
MTKITADHLARQGRAALVTATHTLRRQIRQGKPGRPELHSSFIPAKRIKLTKNGERSNSNVAYADERDIAGLFCAEIPVEQCLPSASLAEASQFITFVGSNGTVWVYRPHVAAINHLPDSDNGELVLPMKVAKKVGRAA